MTNDEYFDSLPVPQREKIYKRQMELALSGYGEEEDLVMVVCWEKAIKEAREKNDKTAS